jgi:hypothetical protein
VAGRKKGNCIQTILFYRIKKTIADGGGEPRSNTAFPLGKNGIELFIPAFNFTP